jgi:hypothetical protein
MTLSDHAIRSSNGDIELEAIYKCRNCEKESKTLAKNLKRGVTMLWRTTEKIEIGPQGFAYKKHVERPT